MIFSDFFYMLGWEGEHPSVCHTAKNIPESDQFILLEECAKISEVIKL